MNYLFLVAWMEYFISRGTLHSSLMGVRGDDFLREGIYIYCVNMRCVRGEVSFWRGCVAGQ